MNEIEKHGALWLDVKGDSRTQPLFESFDPATGFLAIVVRSPLGHFVASVFEKSNDRQWSLPWWSERRPEALFDTLEEAVEYSLVLLRNES